MSIIKVKENKKIDFPSKAINFSEFDNDSIEQKISLPLIVGNNNLNSYESNVYILIENKNGSEEILLDKKELLENEEIVVAYWMVKSYHLIPNNIKIQIKVRDELSDKNWLSYPKELYVNESLNVENTLVRKNPTIFEQIMEKISLIEQKIKEHTSRIYDLQIETHLQDAPSDNIKYGRKDGEWIKINDEKLLAIKNDTLDLEIVESNINTIEGKVKNSPRLGGKDASEYVLKNELTASMIVFDDGETLQDKFNKSTII